MKKYLALICAAMLCVCCLALAACGGGSGSAAPASGSAAASASGSSATAADKAVGSWQLAAIESQGITIAGDFSMFLGSNDKITMNVEKDGKASMSMGGETANLTWEASGDAIKFKKDESSSASSASTSASDSTSNPFFDSSESGSSEFTANIKDGALIIDISQADQSMSMIFTADGTYEGAKIIDPSKADKITAEADLVGEWKLSGMNMMGISMYGSPSDLSAMMGSTDTSAADLSVKLEAGGKGTIMGEACTYTVDSNGVTVSLSGQSLPIKKLGDDIVIDFTALYGMEFAFAFSK